MNKDYKLTVYQNNKPVMTTEWLSYEGVQDFRKVLRQLPSDFITRIKVREIKIIEMEFNN